MDEDSQVSLSEVNPSAQAQQETVSDKKRLILLLTAGSIVVVIIIAFFAVFILGKNNKKLYYQGDAYNRYTEGNFQKSEALAQEGLVKYPNDPTLLRIAIDASSSIGNRTGKEKEIFQKNKPLIENALEVGSSDSNILLAIGYANETAGNYNEALKYYEQAIVLKETADAYFHKGHVLAFLGQTNESKASYEKAFLLDPENPQVLLIKGTLLEQEKKHVEAKEFFLKAADSKHTTKEIRAEALTAISLLEISEGDKQNALTHIQYAVKTDPEYSPAAGLYGLLLTYDANTYNVGTHTLYNAINKNPRITMNYLFMGLALRKAKLTDEAIEYQKEGLRLVDDDNTLVGAQQKRVKKAKMYYELAQTYAIAQDIKNAIQNLNLSFEIEPAYKSVIKNDIKKGYFASILRNQQFSTFLNDI